MLLSEQFYQTEKTGYLNEQFRLFHLKDQTRKEFSYHYHDFHKVVIFISGKAAYHLRRKKLINWQTIGHSLVNRQPSTARRLIHLFHMNVLFSGSKTIFPGRNFWNVSRRQMTETIIWSVWTLLFRKNERHPVWTGKFRKIRWIWKGNPDTVTFSSIYGLSEPYLSGKAVHFW